MSESYEDLLAKLSPKQRKIYEVAQEAIAIAVINQRKQKVFSKLARLTRNKLQASN